MPDEAGHTLASDWPEAPWDATYHDDEGWFGWSGWGFTVANAPPPPFPFHAGPWPVAAYGPPGTVWLYTLGDLIARYTGVPKQVTKAALKAAIRKLGSYTVGGSLYAWRTPEPTGIYEGPHMRALRTTIHGKIGTQEEVAHVLHWRPAAGGDPTLDIPAVRAFGVQIRDAWQDFLHGRAGSSTFEPADVLPTTLRYDEVRTAYVDFVPGVKPAYLIPTQYTPFPTTGVSGVASGASLPYEVAMCISLNTNFRGPRFRGRLYLGPLGFGVMAADGMFSSTASQIGTIFGQKFVQALNANSPYDLHIVSQKYGTSAPVQGVRMGLVPDSQRRRRRSQIENYTQVWGTAVGAAV